MYELRTVGSLYRELDPKAAENTPEKLVKSDSFLSLLSSATNTSHTESMLSLEEVIDDQVPVNEVSVSR